MPLSFVFASAVTVGDWYSWFGWATDLYLDLAVLIRAFWVFVFEHSEKLTAAIGFSYGIYKWWYYRERVLHKRLEEYLKEQDKRLTKARESLLDLIDRPGGSPRFAQPLFAVSSLRRVLTRLGWVPRLTTATAESAAFASLGRALIEIDERAAMARSFQKALNTQRASAHLLRGAIAAARAGNAWSSTRRTNLDQEALRQFRLALEVPGKDHLLQAKEYEVRQLLRVGDRAAAELACQKFEQMTIELLDGRERDLTISRARRWRALLAQAANEPKGALGALRWMNGARKPGQQPENIEGIGALVIRAHYAPFGRWEAVEMAEMHYICAFIRYRLNHIIEEQNELMAARSVYESVLQSLPHKLWRLSSADRKLREACRTGLERVAQAEAKADATYDLAWLLPPAPLAAAASLNDAQNPPQPVSSGSGDDGVTQAS